MPGGALSTPPGPATIIAMRSRARLPAPAIAYWKLGKKSGQPFSENPWGEFAIITDVYRRTGQFEDARTACEEGLSEADLPEPVEAMLRRQMVLIQQGDAARHSMKELPERPEGGQRVVLQ